MISETDLNKLEAALTKYSNLNPSKTFGWDKPSLNIIDCVLSLNRRYAVFALPRVKAFRDKNLDCTTIENLLSLISEYSTYEEFGVIELNYKHNQRIQIIKELCEYLLLEIGSNTDLSDQMEACKKWAIAARPGDSYFLGIKGFGLAGFQYLRMLFGAQTIKPDVHIKRFVSETIDKDISDIQALYCLEKVAIKMNLPLTQLDYQIWQERTGNEE